MTKYERILEAIKLLGYKGPTVFSATDSMLWVTRSVAEEFDKAGLTEKFAMTLTDNTEFKYALTHESLVGFRI